MEFDESGSDTSRCFVPEILMNHLAKQLRAGKAKTGPTSNFFHGVCLLVDISGFTQLSGDFCAEGKGGIDGLQLATNGYMGKLVETIYMFGGDIIKFAGDAILCIFPTTLMTKLIKTRQGRTLRRSMIPDCDLFQATREAIANAVDNPKGLAFTNLNLDDDACYSVGSLPTENAIRPDLLLRAMHCADNLRKITQDTLTVHVALSCGEMCFGVLGGHEDRWECLVSGPCLQELSGCLDDASSMQAVMTIGCFEVLRAAQANLCLLGRSDAVPERFNRLAGYKYAVALLPSGNASIASVALLEVNGVESPDAAAATATSPLPVTPRGRIHDNGLAGLVLYYVPTIVASGIKHGTGLSFISEIREVTTMFMKWETYDSNEKHRDLIELQDCFFEAQKILHTTGAYLRQFLVDDKGCVLIACWGMPSQTYMDNAHRALTAAVEIRTALLQLHMMCSFGITTGDVYCGMVGSALRMEYAAIGNVVNMSARLMGKAHGGILIDEATYLRLPPTAHAALGKLPPMQVKGRAEPMEVYEHYGIPVSLSPAISADNLQEAILELRDCCREPLTTLLNRLSGVRKLRQWRSGALNMIMHSFTGSTPSPTPTPRENTSTMSSVLLEGKKGTGCKASTAWLSKQALKQNTCTVHLKVAENTYLSPFYLLYKIFAQLAPKDLYHSSTCQRRYVHALLKEVYPDDADTAVQVAYPITRQALAITCSYNRGSNPLETSSSVSSGSHGSHSVYMRTAQEKEGQFPARLMIDVLRTIFKHLLTERTVLVIIDDIHNSDEESLRVLVELLKIDSKSAIVMTAVISTERTAEEGIVDDHNGCDNGWAMRYHSLVISNHITVVVAVDVFTTTEIAAMLATVPESDHFPPDLATLVQTLSGGEFAWIKEIIRFLREFGAPRLMAIIGEHILLTPDGEKFSPIVVPPSESAHHDTQRTASYSPSSRKSVSISTQRVHRSRKVGATAELPNQSFGAAPTEEECPQEGFKIDQLVICRFEKLRLSAKQILRTASIIGRTFSRQVLYGVLPRALKGEITSCLHTLVQHQWLQQNAEDQESYEFRHVYSHDIIYNITPESERRNLHKVIADYIEEISAGDASQAAQLCHHYGACDREKALFYTYEAARHMLECNTPLDMCECVDILFAAVSFCSSMHDIEVLHMLVARAIANTRAYRSPPKPLTYRVKRAVRHFRIRRLFFCFGGVKHHSVLPVAGYGVDDDGDPETYGDGGSEDSNNTQLSQNAQARNYFLTLLRHLKTVLEQRKFEILHSGGAEGAAAAIKPWQAEATMSFERNGVRDKK